MKGERSSCVALYVPAAFSRIPTSCENVFFTFLMIAQTITVVCFSCTLPIEILWESRNIQSPISSEFFVKTLSTSRSRSFVDSYSLSIPYSWGFVSLTKKPQSHFVKVCSYLFVDLYIGFLRRTKRLLTPKKQFGLPAHPRPHILTRWSLRKHISITNSLMSW